MYRQLYTDVTACQGRDVHIYLDILYLVMLC